MSTSYTVSFLLSLLSIMPFYLFGQFNRTTDSLALVTFYDSCNGINWVQNNNWKSQHPLENWFGIFTNDTGRVINIQLGNNGISGQLPSSLKNLTCLQQIYLNNNNISGTINQQFEHLNELKLLNLSFNKLRGKLNNSLVTLSSLEELNLSANRFSGNLPNWFDSLPNLRSISLYNNQFSGSIPGSIFNTPKLQDLTLTDNNLSGVIPTTLQNANSLVDLFLSTNQLSGPIPDITNLTKLRSFYAPKNQLSGKIPFSLSNSSSIQYLNLIENHFLFEDLLSPKPQARYFYYSPQNAKYDSIRTIFAIYRDSVSVAISAYLPDNQYQWYLNNTLLVGKTTNTLKIDSVKASDTGMYYVKVSNPQLSTLQIASHKIRLIGMYPLSTKLLQAHVVKQSHCAIIQWRANFAHRVDSMLISTFDGIREINIFKKEYPIDEAGQFIYIPHKRVPNYYKISLWNHGSSIASRQIVAQEEKNQKSFYVFPVPSRDKIINVTANRSLITSTFEILIYSSSGQIAFRKSYDSADSTFQINLQKLQKGRYFMAIQSDTYTSKVKSIIIH